MLFFVVRENLTPILGKRAAEQMHLITVYYDVFKSVCKVTSDDAELSLSLIAAKH